MEPKIIKRYKIAKRMLIFWCLFIGIGAIGGSLCFLIKSDGSIMGMDKMLPYFQVLPFSKYLFQNYIFSGIALLIVNGLTNILASVLLIKNKRSGIVLGTIFGFTLMLWIVIQFIIFPFNFMSTIYFIFGICQLITGYACIVYYEQSKFTFNESEYKNIGKNKRELVVYYSRDGYTKKIAHELANEKGADILEIKTTEKTKGFLGFMWCGRFGVRRKCMSIDKHTVDLEKFDKVTICSPIWVFGISAPIRSFVTENIGKIKNVDYVFVHFMRAKFRKVADYLDKTLKTKRNSLTNICCRFGKIIKKSSDGDK